MLTPEDSGLLIDMNQRLRDLHAQMAKAQRCLDQVRVDELQAEIEELTQGCDKVLDDAEAI